jgi:penicillin-binding protein 1C
MRHLRKLAIVTGALLIATLCGGLVLDRLYPPDLARLKSHSVMVLADDGQILRAFSASGGAWRFPVKPEEVDPKFLRFLIAYEDQRFTYHPGVDPLAIVRAAGQAIAAGEIVSGASTLSMQTARLLEPRPRVMASKLIEMARAVQLEARLFRQGAGASDRGAGGFAGRPAAIAGDAAAGSLPGSRQGGAGQGAGAFARRRGDR